LTVFFVNLIVRYKNWDLWKRTPFLYLYIIFPISEVRGVYYLSNIVFRSAGIKDISSQLSKTIVQVSDTTRTLSSLTHSIDNRILSRREIGSRLYNSINTLHTIESQIKALKNVLDFGYDRYNHAEKRILSLSASMDRCIQRTVSAINSNQKEKTQRGYNESIFAFSIAAGFNSYGAVATRGGDIFGLAKSYKDYRKGFKIEKYITKSGEVKYRVKKPTVAGFSSPKGSSHNKVYSNSYIKSQLSIGNQPKVAEYMNPGTGVKAALKSKVGWIGVGVTTVENITKNVSSGASFGKTVGDATVDVGVGAVVIAAGAVVSAFAVTAGAPILVGAVTAAGVSVAASYLLDGLSVGKEKDKKTISNHLKDGVQTIAGWFKDNKK
jgi:hypothetical protein